MIEKSQRNQMKQSVSYLGEDDIVRFEDSYGRSL